MQLLSDHDAKATLAELGGRVRAWRARRGMTRKQLAHDSGLSERFLADVESGKGNVSINSLEATARARGFAIGMGSAFTVTVDAVATWVNEARKRGIEIVPISAVASDPEKG